MNMTTPQQIISLIPQLLEYRPRRAVVAIMADTTNSEPTQSTIGPILVWDLERSCLDPKFPATLAAFAHDVEAGELVIVWYDDPTVETCHEQISAMIIDACGHVPEHLDVTTGQKIRIGAYYTDYSSYRILPAQKGSEEYELGLPELRQCSHPFAQIPAVETQDVLYRGFEHIPEWSIACVERYHNEYRNDVVDRFFNYVARGELSHFVHWEDVLSRLDQCDPQSTLHLSKVLPRNTPQVLARLLAHLTRFDQRDALLLWALDSSYTSLGEVNVDDMRKKLYQLSMRCPSMRRIRLLSFLLIELARLSADDDARPYAMLAYLSWWSGDGYRGAAYEQLAYDSDPTYPMACLLHHAYRAVLPPPWVLQYQRNNEKCLATKSQHCERE
ncbi:DUF4192 family protein [Arcanobacterium canis]